MKHCLWSDDDVPDDQAVQVGTTAAITGPGAPVYACSPCVDTYGLLPITEHPPGATGAPLAVDRRYIGRRHLPPIAPGQPA